ncbi:MAG TPA: hypothetical protein VHT70_00735 [Candidatus Saccharimonadales bacterium]|jgi:hypothetical protein|nr:hypothetical protein [Candidatus Saccharimonadales bacterium]
MEYGSEYTSIEEAAAALQSELYAAGPDQAEIDEQHEAFTRAVNEAVGLYPNPDQQRAIAIAAGICDWVYFGERDNPLPTGLIKVVDDETKSVRVMVDRGVVDTRDVVYARNLFENNAGHRLWGHIPTFATLGEAQVEAAAYEVVKQTEGHKIIHAMATPPPKPPQPYPIPPWLRAAREAQIETDVRRQYGIREEEHIARRSPADMARRRALFHLDDEQLPAPPETANSSDPIHKLRRYFEPIILDQLRDLAKFNDPSTEITEFRLDRNKNYVADADESVHFDSYSYLPEHYQTLRQPGAYAADIPFESNYLEDICNAAFSGKYNPDEPQTYDEVMATAADLTLNFSREVLSGHPFGEYGDDFLLSIHALLRQPDGPAVYFSQFTAQPHADERLMRPKIDLMSEQQIRDLEGQIIGRIQQYDAALYSPARLIQTAYNPNRLPLHDAQTELAFTFWRTQLGGDIPFVPGYKVVSHDPFSGEWGFMPDPAGDPYAEAAVSIPPENMQKLTEIYDTLGLHTLAQTLRNTPNVTVANLTQYIHENTRYVVPKKASYFSNTSLKNFDTHVYKGELALQCTGSATFLMRSLELVFGEGCAAVQSGLVLPSVNTEVNAAKHMQVSFVHDGQTFMLDATGRLDSNAQGMVANFASHAQQPNASAAPRIELPPTPPAPPIATVTETFQQERLQHATQSFEQQLQLMFDLPDTQALIEHIAVRSEDDPLRRSLAVLRDEHATVDALEQTLSYVTAITKADEATLRTIHLQHYYKHEALDVAQDALRAALEAHSD